MNRPNKTPPEAAGVSLDAAGRALGVDRRLVSKLVLDYEIQPVGIRAENPVYRLQDIKEALEVHRDPISGWSPKRAMEELVRLAANIGRLAGEGDPDAKAALPILLGNAPGTGPKESAR